MTFKTSAEALSWLLNQAQRVSGCQCPCGVYEIRIIEAELTKLQTLASTEVARAVTY